MLESMETQQRIARLVGSGENVILWGPPGTGKSSFVRACAKLGSIPMSTYPITRAASGQAVFSLLIPDGQSWRRADGPCLRAAKRGGILLLDDVHVAGPDVESAIYSAADRHEIELPDGTSITPEPGYCVWGTSNVNPEKLPPAIRSRFTIEVHVPGVLPATIVGMPQWAINLLASVTPDGKSDGRQIPIDTRNLWSVVRLSERWTEEQALSLVYGDAQGKAIADGIRVAAISA